MEYTIRQMAELAGVSSRTLRYYDEIGLLKPGRVNEAGYRFYGEKEVGLLQQILFYREWDLGLDTIKRIMNQPDFDVLKALEEHLRELSKQQAHISALIQTVELTLADLKGDYEMSDERKFEAFKKQLVEEKEKQYGQEVREAYGDEAADAANERVLGMSQADYERFQNLEKEVLRQLEEAVIQGEKPESDVGKRIVLLHKEWLGYTWKEYSAQAHKGVAMLYTADKRFTDYYDRNVAGCGAFLAAAVDFWAGKEA